MKIILFTSKYKSGISKKHIVKSYLNQVFCKYAAADNGKADNDNTISMREYIKLLNACKLIGPDFFSIRQAQEIFSKCSYDDESVYQEADPDNFEAELIFFEHCRKRRFDPSILLLVENAAISINNLR